MQAPHVGFPQFLLKDSELVFIFYDFFGQLLIVETESRKGHFKIFDDQLVKLPHFAPTLLTEGHLQLGFLMS